MTLMTAAAAQPPALDLATRIDDSVEIAGAQLRWSLLPWALLRTPGLPVATLDAMTAPAAFHALDAVGAAADRVDEAATAYLAGRPEFTEDRTARRQLRRARAAVRDRRAMGGAGAAALVATGSTLPGRWSELLAAREQATEAAREAHALALQRARQAALQRGCRADVAHALFLSGIDFFENGYVPLLADDRRLREDSRDRVRVATLARYLRRLTVRCEQASFFGPTHYVHLAPEQGHALALGPSASERVYVGLSAWLLDELGRREYRNTALGARRPRRHPLFAVSAGGGLVCRADGRVAPAEPDAVALWSELDGELTLARACERAGVALEDAPRLLASLGPLVIHAHQVPAHATDAFESLLQRAPADGLAGGIERLRKEFEHTPWPQRRETFARAERVVHESGIVTRRGRGSHYADRYVFNEERTHPLSAATTLGAPVIDSLHGALADILPLSYLSALVAREDARDVLRSHLGGRARPLAELLARPLQPAPTPRTDRLGAQLSELVERRAAGGVARLTRADVEELFARLAPSTAEDDPLAAVVGPDLMIAGGIERPRWVLSEIHDDGSYIAGSVTCQHPLGDELREEFERRVVEVIDPERMAAVVGRRRNKFLTPELPGVAIELGGVSSKPRSQVVPIADVEVAPDGCVALIGGQRRHLYTGDIPSLVHRALAVPSLVPPAIELGSHTPRIQVGPTVIQRARWRVALLGGARGFDGWRAMDALRRAEGLPRRVFVRHPDEPKPLFLDFADPLAVEDVARLAEGEILVTEMMPDPTDLWWAPDGEPRCAELRLCCLVEFEPARAPGSSR